MKKCFRIFLLAAAFLPTGCSVFDFNGTKNAVPSQPATPVRTAVKPVPLKKAFAFPERRKFLRRMIEIPMFQRKNENKDRQYVSDVLDALCGLNYGKTLFQLETEGRFLNGKSDPAARICHADILLRNGQHEKAARILKDVFTKIQFRPEHTYLQAYAGDRLALALNLAPETEVSRVMKSAARRIAANSLLALKLNIYDFADELMFFDGSAFSPEFMKLVDTQSIMRQSDPSRLTGKIRKASQILYRDGPKSAVDYLAGTVTEERAFLTALIKLASMERGFNWRGVLKSAEPEIRKKMKIMKEHKIISGMEGCLLLLWTGNFKDAKGEYDAIPFQERRTETVAPGFAALWMPERMRDLENQMRIFLEGDAKKVKAWHDAISVPGDILSPPLMNAARDLLSSMRADHEGSAFIRRETVMALSGLSAERISRNDYADPLFFAVQNKRTDIVTFLASVDEPFGRIPRKGKRNILAAALDQDFPDELCLKMLEKGADSSVRTKNGETPLIAALRKNLRKTALLLIRMNSDLNVPDKRDGMVPLSLALLADNTEAALELVKLNAKIDLRDKAGNTPLHVAAFKNAVSVIREMEKHGIADLPENLVGKTPLDVATDNKLVEMSEILRAINKKILDKVK